MLGELMISICIAAALYSVPGSFAVGSATSAGVARIDITPPIELKASLGGYGERMNRPATGIHDRIWAKAIVLRQGERRFALVTADMLALPPGFKSAVLEKLNSQGASGTPATSVWKEDQVILLPSHSHTSIDMTAINPKNTFGIPQLGVFHPALYERTRDLFAQVISDAARTETPCRAGTRSVKLTGWNHNRRKDSSATQPELTVTRFDSETGPIAALVNWTAHPTFMDADAMEYSGDWPGQMQRTVEALIGGGVTVMYYNGAEGDQSPIARPDSGGSWEKAERYGREIGLQVWGLWKQVKTSPTIALEYHLEPISLPTRMWHPDFMKTGGTEYGLTEDGIRAIVERMVPVATHSVSVRIGDLVIAGVPGELASDLGDQVKQRIHRKSGVEHVVIGGLADEWISYIITPTQYHNGGYEASMSFFGDGLGATIVEGVARGANALLH
jgi:neutral ceramidase